MSDLSGKPKLLFSLILSLKALVCFSPPLHGCIWDSDTLSEERRTHPKLAEAILNPGTKATDPAPLRQRIHDLQANPRKDDPEWWNNLAGAHLRLGEADEAARLLEPLTTRFETNYGIHANLGTAYHLLGRYKEAEREIARDLEINPEAHFGLEKYHLALLQYLIRDPQFKMRHVYLEEFTYSFLQGSVKARPMPVPIQAPDTDETNAASRAKLELEFAALPVTGRSTNSALRPLLIALAGLDDPPDYCSRWNLGADEKLEDGVIYMATLNPREPACFVMLGMKALHNRHLNLSINAFEQAIRLGSPQKELLQSHIDRLREHIRKARAQHLPLYVAIIAIACVVGVYVLLKVRARRRHRGATPQPIPS